MDGEMQYPGRAPGVRYMDSVALESASTKLQMFQDTGCLGLLDSRHCKASGYHLTVKHTMNCLKELVCVA